MKATGAAADGHSRFDAGMPLLARVEWRSEGRAAERPTALVVGGERIDVEVVDRWLEGSAVAGGEVVHHFVVSDRQGREYRVRRASSGRVAVETLLRCLVPRY